MCALRQHNSKSILEKIYWELKKLLMDLLMCVLRAHINRSLYIYIHIYIYICYKKILKIFIKKKKNFKN